MIGAFAASLFGGGVGRGTVRDAEFGDLSVVLAGTLIGMVVLDQLG